MSIPKKGKVYKNLFIAQVKPKDNFAYIFNGEGK